MRALTEVVVPRFDNPIELQFAGEAASALGQAGRKLRRTLDALRRYDDEVARAARRSSTANRENLVMEAAEAFWAYVVQREQFGLLDSEYIATEYAVPDEVKRVMGPKTPTEIQAGRHQRRIESALLGLNRFIGQIILVRRRSGRARCDRQ